MECRWVRPGRAQRDRQIRRAFHARRDEQRSPFSPRRSDGRPQLDQARRSSSSACTTRASAAIASTSVTDESINSSVFERLLRRASGRLTRVVLTPDRDGRQTCGKSAPDALTGWRRSASLSPHRSRQPVASRETCTIVPSNRSRLLHPRYRPAAGAADSTVSRARCRRTVRPGATPRRRWTRSQNSSDPSGSVAAERFPPRRLSSGRPSSGTIRTIGPSTTISIGCTSNPRPAPDGGAARRGSFYERAFKRAFDIVFASLAILVSLPLCPLIMLAIWIEDGGPFFFSHKRETCGGREFPA